MTDSCPNCCRRDVPPAAEHHCGESVVHACRCPACGHHWTTSRLHTAYPDTRREERGRAA